MFKLQQLDICLVSEDKLVLIFLNIFGVFLQTVITDRSSEEWHVWRNRNASKREISRKVK